MADQIIPRNSDGTYNISGAKPGVSYSFEGGGANINSIVAGGGGNTRVLSSADAPGSAPRYRERTKEDAEKEEREYQEFLKKRRESAQKAKQKQISDSLERFQEESSVTADQWDNAWKKEQMKLVKENSPKEDHSIPTPLLLDKISVLPADSERRRNAEILTQTFEGKASVAGEGLDALTKESYRDLQRLSKHSEIIQNTINSNEPPPTAKDMLGEEEGKAASNLQSWKAPLINAVKPVSEAIGSHADTNSSISKSPIGPVQVLPQTALVAAKDISSDMVSNVEEPVKQIQNNILIEMPSKEAGSLRHMMACPTLKLNLNLNLKFKLPSLNFNASFDLISDAYNGLMSLINKVSKLIDTIINKITSFVISAVGGLIDSIFPPGLLSKLIALVTKAINMIHDLFSWLGGFIAISKISTQMRNGDSVGCAGNEFGINTRAPKASKKNKTYALDTIVGGFNGVGNGLGNFGFVAGMSSTNGKASKHIKKLGSMIADIHNPQELLQRYIDASVLKLLDKIPFLCCVGTVGNQGYSVGNSFDSLRNNAFSVAMSTYAAHASIISANFNKVSLSVGKFAQAPSTATFENLPFVPGAQGSKGVIMHGPGGTEGRKVFRL
jgi:hypothetical protein